MVPHKKFTVRIVIYSIALLYLAGDLFLFNGPVSQRIHDSRIDSPEAIEFARSQGVVARVSGYPILLSQVERAAKERLWLEGKTMDQLTPEQRREQRLAALNDLVDHQLLRMKVKANGNELPVSDEEINEAIRRLASRFSNRSEMQKELAAEGIDSEKELRLRLGARLQQVKYIERLVGRHLAVSEEEARAWFEGHAKSFELPARVKVRHVFLSTLNRPSEDAKSKLSAAMKRLKAGEEEFSNLALELSEDERTKRSGGDLGWMTLERLPADFGEPVFRMEVNQPELLRTKIGWHLVEVMERREPEPRSFEDARDEVMAALESARRMELVAANREAIRKTDKIGIHIDTEMITGE